MYLTLFLLSYIILNKLNSNVNVYACLDLCSHTLMTELEVNKDENNNNTS